MLHIFSGENAVNVPATSGIELKSKNETGQLSNFFNGKFK